MDPAQGYDHRRVMTALISGFGSPGAFVNRLASLRARCGARGTGRSLARAGFESRIGLLLSLVLWLGASLTHAQEARHQEFLWSVSHRNATVYLLGSIHNLRQSDYPLPSLYDDAFRQAAQVAFEANLDEFNSPATLAYLVRKGLYPPGDSIQQHVSADTYQLIKSYEKKRNLTISDSSRPWFAAYYIRGQEARRRGLAEIGVDQHFFDRAKAEGRRTLALETAAFQIDLLADASEAQQEQELRELLLNIDNFGTGTSELVDFWKAGNVAMLAADLQSIRETNPDWFRRFISDRNAQWLPQIEAYLAQEQTTLVIVGAGHLVGRDSVVALLRRKGHTVRQLPLLPSRWIDLQPVAGGELRLSFDVISGHHYAIEASSDLQAWNVIHNFVSSPATRAHQDRVMPSERRFYRLRNLDEE